MTIPLNKKFKKPYIAAIHLMHEIDQYPDLSYLETSEKPDNERLEDYNNNYWHMIGIYATADIIIPFRSKYTKNKIHHKMIPIKSSGLWGIESDSDHDFIEQTETEQINDLKFWLKKLNVTIPKGVEIIQYDK